MSFQRIELPLGGGLDATTDPKRVQLPNLLALENLVFRGHPGLELRNGYTLLSNALDEGTDKLVLKHVATRGDELVGFDDDQLYSFDEARSRWISRGRCVTAVAQQSNLFAQQRNQYKTTVSSTGDITLVAWEESDGVHYGIYSNNGTYIVVDATIEGASRPKSERVGNNIHLYYAVVDDTELRLRVFHALKPEQPTIDVAITAELEINTNYDPYNIRSYGSVCFIAYANDDGVDHTMQLVSYTDIGSVEIVGSSASGFIREVETGDTCEGVKNVSIDVTPTEIWVAWSNNDGGGGPAAQGTYVYIIDRAGAAVSSTSDTSKSAEGLAVWASREVDGTGGLFITTTHATLGSRVIRYHPVTSGTVGAVATSFAGLELASGNVRFWMGRPYVMALRRSFVQSQYYLVDHTGFVAGRFAAGLATDELHVGNQALIGQESEGVWLLPLVLRYNFRVPKSSNRDTPDEMFANHTVAHVKIDFTHADRYQTIDMDGCLYIGGSMLWCYDGAEVCESGFLEWPEPFGALITTSSQNTANGAMTTGSYPYRFYYERYTHNWKRVLSAGEPRGVTLSGAGNDTVRFNLPYLHVTNSDQAVGISVYRGVVNADVTAGVPMNRVSSPDPDTAGATLNGFLLNVKTSGSTGNWDEGAADSTITDKELDPAYGGVLPNIQPDHPRMLFPGNGRLWAVVNDLTVWPSKLIEPNTVVNFSDVLAFTAPPDGGPVTGVASMNNVTLIFKRDRTYAVPGDGPDNTGGGQLFGKPELLPIDVGCTNHKSITRIPGGIVFQSHRGIVMLSQNMELVEVGAAMLRYADANIRSAVLVPSDSEVRFITDNETLVYNYRVRQWSIFTGVCGASATLWRDRLTLAMASGRVLYETVDEYTDGGARIVGRIGLPWLTDTVPQGRIRVRYMYLLGDFKSAHTLRCRFQYDYFGEAEITTVEPEGAVATVGLGSGGLGEDYLGGFQHSEGAYQFRVEVPRQECQALRVTIDLIPESPYGLGFSLSSLVLELTSMNGPWSPAVRQNF